MNKGLVYTWIPDAVHPLGGRVAKSMVDLGRLDQLVAGRPILRSALVDVRNGGRYYLCHEATDDCQDVAIGNAGADGDGNFRFETGKGGGRLDKKPRATERFRQRYIQASHFGEVNTYYHLSRIAGYAASLLDELGEPRLPAIIAVVNAHHAVSTVNGVRDGWQKRKHTCHPFQGGHYRLPSKRNSIAEHYPVAETGEIHLGPGRKLLDSGALVELEGTRYRANASHNAGIIYHEYGHHISRHTADFMVNHRRKPHRQNNIKPAIDEGTCDYWTAVMLQTPHIWSFHRRHDAEHRHPRSLASQKTMDDFDPAAEADPHTNGTIWGAALWDLRCAMQQLAPGGDRMADLRVMKALALIGKETAADSDIKRSCLKRADYGRGLALLLEADRILFDARFSTLIADIFAKRKIVPNKTGQVQHTSEIECLELSTGLKRLPAEEIPRTADLLSAELLTGAIAKRNIPEYSIIGVGDIMLGDRTYQPMREWGEDYPFAGVLPLLKHSAIVCANLEGPLAREADRQHRTFSYRVAPGTAHALKRANVNVVSLANNHLTDCGREGILETFTALNSAGIHKIGAGTNEVSAHEPVVLDAGPLRVGILGYYWNKRCAATPHLPGSAMDGPDWLQADIQALRLRVDRVVAIFHWGVPYARTPLWEDEVKARQAVDFGADLVIGHHPHIMQKFEIYKSSPIFFSVGNFAFGSGNSKAEGLMVAARFEPERTAIDIYPIYVKNRDSRVNYQPKVLAGVSSQRILERLAKISGAGADHLDIEGGVGRLRLPRPELVGTTK